MNILRRKVGTVNRISNFIIHHDNKKKQQVGRNEDVEAYAATLEPSVVVTARALAGGSSAVASAPSRLLVALASFLTSAENDFSVPAMPFMCWSIALNLAVAFCSMALMVFSVDVWTAAMASVISDKDAANTSIRAPICSSVSLRLSAAALST